MDGILYTCPFIYKIYQVGVGGGGGGGVSRRTLCNGEGVLTQNITRRHMGGGGGG